MERTAHWVVATAAVAVAGGVSYVLLGAGYAVSIANAGAYGAFGWLSVEHWDLLHAGNQPWSVGRLWGVASGYVLFVSLVVLQAGTSTAPVGERAALTALVFGTTWAGIGVGVSVARADAAAGDVE